MKKTCAKIIYVEIIVMQLCFKSRSCNCEYFFRTDKIIEILEFFLFQRLIKTIMLLIYILYFCKYCLFRKFHNYSVLKLLHRYTNCQKVINFYKKNYLKR